MGVRVSTTEKNFSEFRTQNQSGDVSRHKSYDIGREPYKGLRECDIRWFAGVTSEERNHGAVNTGTYRYNRIAGSDK